jgi:hypothetical protein
MAKIREPANRIPKRDPHPCALVRHAPCLLVRLIDTYML